MPEQFLKREKTVSLDEKIDRLDARAYKDIRTSQIRTGNFADWTLLYKNKPIDIIEYRISIYVDGMVIRQSNIELIEKYKRTKARRK